MKNLDSNFHLQKVKSNFHTWNRSHMAILLVKVCQDFRKVFSIIWAENEFTLQNNNVTELYLQHSNTNGTAK